PRRPPSPVERPRGVLVPPAVEKEPDTGDFDPSRVGVLRGLGKLQCAIETTFGDTGLTGRRRPQTLLEEKTSRLRLLLKEESENLRLPIDPGSLRRRAEEDRIFARRSSSALRRNEPGSIGSRRF